MLHLLLLLFYFTQSFAQVLPCAFVTPNGNTVVDLTPLMKNDTDYFIPKGTVNDQDWDLWINICRPIVANVCINSVGGQIACQRWDPNNPLGNAGMGRAATQMASFNGDNISLRYTGGLDQRETQIDFMCDPNGGIGKPVFIGETVQHHYAFQFVSKYACPISTCGSSSDCQGCLSSSSCRWCLTDDVCISRKNMTCESYIDDIKRCPADGCSQSTNCLDCVTNGCSWCLDSSYCVKKTNTQCQNKVSDKKWCSLNPSNLFRVN